VLLADQLFKCAWAPFAREDLVTHGVGILMFQGE
jgi:hypothetical protein